MSQSLSNVIVHIVFSTKRRQPFLNDSSQRTALQCYLARVSAELGCPAIAVGGVEDHVHVLARQARTVTLAGWIRELKRASAFWLKRRPHAPEGFQWQLGYGAFSVSQSQTEAVRRYIIRQSAHHADLNFQDELRSLLSRYQIPYDERYLWD